MRMVDRSCLGTALLPQEKICVCCGAPFERPEWYPLPIETATGSLFRIKYPDDWLEEELYDFDWMVLKNQKDRFEKINFDAIPC